MVVETPNTNFIQRLYPDVYDPAEDTYLLLDALEADFGSSSKATQVQLPRSFWSLEIGSGSGCVSVFLAGLIRERLGISYGFHYCTDLNKQATLATLELVNRTDSALTSRFEVLNTSFVDGFQKRRIQGAFDVILFNPPYVPTSDDELGSQSIEAAWAGGKRGRRVLDLILNDLPSLLATQGTLYLVAVRENDPNEIVAILQSHGLKASIALERRAGREHLFIIKGVKGARATETP